MRNHFSRHFANVVLLVLQFVRTVVACSTGILQKLLANSILYYRKIVHWTHIYIWCLSFLLFLQRPLVGPRNIVTKIEWYKYFGHGRKYYLVGMEQCSSSSQWRSCIPTVTHLMPTHDWGNDTPLGSTFLRQNLWFCIYLIHSGDIAGVLFQSNTTFK